MKTLKKLFIVLFDIILAAFILTILLYKISEIDRVNGGSIVPGIAGTGFVAVNDEHQDLGIDRGDMIITSRGGIDNLKSGDIIAYLSETKEVTIGKVGTIKGSNCMLESGASGTGGSLLPVDRIEGIYRVRVPYLGYITTFTDTQAGTIVCVAVPILLVMGFVSVILIDNMHNKSRHKKRIMRRKQRRRARYAKEGSYGNKRAMV